MNAAIQEALRSSGFTLIELVTTIIIVGVLSAVAAPRFFDNDAFSQRGYADELAASLVHAGRVATASRCQVRFSVNEAGYSARMRTGCTAGAWNTVVRRGDGSNLTGAPTAGIVAAPNTVLVLGIDGTASANAVINIGAFQVNIVASTGEVRVYP